VFVLHGPDQLDLPDHGPLAADLAAEIGEQGEDGGDAASAGYENHLLVSVFELAMVTAVGSFDEDWTGAWGCILLGDLHQALCDPLLRLDEEQDRLSGRSSFSVRHVCLVASACDCERMVIYRRDCGETEKDVLSRFPLGERLKCRNRDLEDFTVDIFQRGFSSLEAWGFELDQETAAEREEPDGERGPEIIPGIEGHAGVPEHEAEIDNSCPDVRVHEDFIEAMAEPWDTESAEEDEHGERWDAGILESVSS